LADDGATACTTPGEAVAGADVVVSLLYDADSVLDVVGSVVEAMRATVWVQSSTIELDGIRRVTAFAEEHGLRVLDAPILGTQKPADESQPVVLASGSAGGNPPGSERPRSCSASARTVVTCGLASR
jgi:3-hydroxyisobutyrate dehydrogenase